MDSLSALIAMCIALSVGVVSPGPSFLMIASTSLSQGRRAGWAASLGMGVVGTAYATAAALGLAALITASPVFFNGFKLVGALYLGYIAVSLLRHAKNALPASPEKDHKRSAFWRGVITQASNPKTIVVYASVFAAFLPKEPDTWLLIALPIICGLIELAWYTVVSNLFTSKASQAGYLRHKATFDRIAGVVMFGLAAWLATPVH